VTQQSPRAIGLIGPGRAGVGLALALAQADYSVFLHGRNKKSVPAPLKLTVGDGGKPPWISDVDVVVLTVRDDAITPLAASLANSGAIAERHVVLHLSGAQGQEALGPLVTTRAALGSFHPLQTIVEPEQTPARLKGAWAAVEGMPRALEAGEQIATDLGMRPFRIATKSKAIYHAGAVFASNYLVVVGRAALAPCGPIGCRCVGRAAAAGPWHVRKPGPVRTARGAHGTRGARRYRDDRASPAIVSGGRRETLSCAGPRGPGAGAKAGNGRADGGEGGRGAGY
jgi:hypothetical protein